MALVLYNSVETQVVSKICIFTSQKVKNGGFCVNFVSASSPTFSSSHGGHRQMLRAASKSAAGHGLRRAALARNPSRYAMLIASSAAAVLTRSYAEEYQVSPVAVVQPPKQHGKNVTEVRRNAAKSIRRALEWLLKTLRALLRCGLLWLNFLPAVATSPVLALQSETLSAWWWGLFRSSVCNAGPTFIKFSQWAAMRPDLFPGYVCDELSKLQSGAKKHSWAQTHATLKKVLGEDYDKILHIREDSLVGSGCVAQVYRGNMVVPTNMMNNHHDDSMQTVEVAVKVLHPGVREAMQLDLNLMRSVAAAAEWVGELLLRACYTPSVKHNLLTSTPTLEEYPLRCVSLSETVETFATFMQSQLDLTQEGAALDRLNKNFSVARWKNRVLVPATIYLDKNNNETHRALPHPDVLVETYQEGESMIAYINSVTAAAAALDGKMSPESRGGADAKAAAAQLALNKEVAALGLDAILKMLFEDNFVHADLHAGNMLVRREGDAGHAQLILLDAGLVVELQPFDRRNFVSLFRAVIENDGREVARLMMEYSPRTKSASGTDILATVIRPEEYADEMAALVSHVHAQGLSLGKISVSALLRRVLQLSYEHNVKLESRFVSVVVAIMLAEGMGRRLDPDIDIIARAQPFVRAAALSMLLNK